MAGETQNISELADKVSKGIFKWLKWEQVGTTNENFTCLKQQEHSATSGTHPNDVVFKYKDPYLNRNIFLNIDLKSYTKGSITATLMRGALVSLANTIDCAYGSKEWKDRYSFIPGISEIRGMLFVYNHDGNFDQNFYDVFNKNYNPNYNPNIESKKKTVNLDNIPLKQGQKIHIIEPRVINYLQSIITDLALLSSDGKFPLNNKFQFFYPDLCLHKASGSPSDHPATVELITGPFLILKHNDVYQYDEDIIEKTKTYNHGYVIYYNGEGSNEYEFVYIFDTLSKYQLLDGNEKIRIRIVNPNIYKDVRAIFTKAKNTYCEEWGFDSHKMEIINQIEFNQVEFTKPNFSSIEIGWERK